jgi:UDP-N-acetylglucosamine 1-carboxyvinyltransferase
MGAVVRGAGTSRIEVEGVESLHPTTHTVVPDRVVAATFLAAAGMTGGEVTIADARPDHMEMLLRKVNQMGVVTDMGPHGLRASATGRLVAADVATLPYPGRGHRLQPVAGGHADGGRRRGHPDREPLLRALPLRGGAAPHGGRHPDRGAPRRGARRAPPLGRAGALPDIRAGVALVLAGLVAEGRRWSADAHHIGRGYEDLVGALGSLGAKVTGQ